MVSIEFTTENIISLTRLEMTVRKEYGQRFNLSDSSSLLGLLKLAAESSAHTVKQAFQHFIDGLHEDGKQQLVYRGVVINKDNVVSQITKPTKPSSNGLPEGVIKVVYRGQTIYKKNDVVIDDPFSETNIENTASSVDKATTKTSAKRVYRGQVIDD